MSFFDPALHSHRSHFAQDFMDVNALIEAAYATHIPEEQRQAAFAELCKQAQTAYEEQDARLTPTRADMERVYTL